MAGDVRVLLRCASRRVAPLTHRYEIRMASSRRPRTEESPRVGFVSHGCPKALDDSEQILTQLRTEAYANAASYASTDLLVVTTRGDITTTGPEAHTTTREA